MRQAAKQITICAAALFLAYVLCRVLFLRSLTVYVPLPPEEANISPRSDIRVDMDQPDIIGLERTLSRSGLLKLMIRPKVKGETWITLQDSDGDTLSSLDLRVGRFHTVYDRKTGGFTGDSLVLVMITLFWFLAGMVMIWHYFKARGSEYYHYSTIYFAGFALFAFASCGLMLRVTVRHLLHPTQFTMMDGYSTIYSASRRFMMFTTPPILIFALALAISNIVLLRHEKFSYKNILGFLVGILLIVGEAIGWAMFLHESQGPKRLVQVWNTLENTYATIFVYFECTLVGSVICGIHASRREPALDKDFIIILGCWFRKDGTLSPLLRGRVDKAIAFWRRQKDETGRAAYLIPSGGQGKDEPMPEGEAMRRYLIQQDIPDGYILAETKSCNTYQNMSYSGKIIHQVNPNGKVAFATNSYHVFRGGVWANMVGLGAEGIGSKTRWWFWPNAFMRETVGLLYKRWKQELLWLLLMIIFFDLLSLALG